MAQIKLSNVNAISTVGKTLSSRFGITHVAKGNGVVSAGREDIVSVVRSLLRVGLDVAVVALVEVTDRAPVIKQ